MGLREYMSKHTRRDHLSWLAWFEEQMNRPARTDYYLMQIASFLDMLLQRVPGRSTQSNLVTFRVRFGDQAKPRPGPVPVLTKESIAQVRSAIAKARAGPLRASIRSAGPPHRTQHSPRSQ